jgi:Glycosyl hydrolase family 65, N-terminal domain
VPLRFWRWIFGHACRAPGQPRADLGRVAGILYQMGVLATLLRGRPVRDAQHRTAGARAGADWSRVRILLDGEPLLVREGEVQLAVRKLDMRWGLLLSAWTRRTPAGLTATRRGLRLLSLADRAIGLQLMQLSLDRDGVEASFALAGLGMEPIRLEQDLGTWRAEGTEKGAARRCGSVASSSPRTVRFLCVGSGTGAPWPGRPRNSTV